MHIWPESLEPFKVCSFGEMIERVFFWREERNVKTFPFTKNLFAAQFLQNKDRLFKNLFQLSNPSKTTCI